MAIEKRKLFESTRERWPSFVEVVPADGLPSFKTTPNLTDIYTAVEAACESASERTAEDEWIGLANWSFHQALWVLAENLGLQGKVFREDVTFEMFDAQMRSNLSDDCWRLERLEYEGSPSRIN
jgi:hypothetical protein